MTPEKETELFATLSQIVGMLQQQNERIARIEGRLDGIDGRLNDQGRILAALVPSRIAAVPPPAA